MSQYSTQFFENIRGGSQSSAEIILSILRTHATFSSVVDIGCGPASWLSAAAQVFQIAPEEALGIDGPYSAGMHAGKPGRFQYQDLTAPLQLPRRFDLAICVEVAEHLPEKRASSLVNEICMASDVVVFGAAIPGQGGTGHVNEQWPSYWMARFSEEDFAALDAFRPAVWSDSLVAPWYAQNTFLFVRRGHALADVLHAAEVLDPDDWKLKMVHPGILELSACETAGASRLLKALPRTLSNSIRRRLPGFRR